MGSIVDSLTAWGDHVRPAEMVELAAACGLPVAVAAALLEQESGGGRNVWGSDAVSTGGAYMKGAPVTEQTYRAYRAALAARTAGQQGVGPCQLTSVDYQDAADRLGGCWDWRSNCTVGFRLLAGYIARWDLARAFRAYNGGQGTVTDPARYPSPAAHVYEQHAMAKYRTWVTRLGASSTLAATVADHPAAPLPAPTLGAPLEEDRMYIKCQPNPNGPILLALLHGPFFIGLGSPGEQHSADEEIKAGAPLQWVELGTWQELDRRSHAICDAPRTVAVVRDDTRSSAVPPA